MAHKVSPRPRVTPQGLPLSAEGDAGDISDEYSDDDDPGYRIVLVEDVGELYPDISYKQRHSRGMPISTPERASKSTKDKKPDDGVKSREKQDKEKETSGDSPAEAAGADGKVNAASSVTLDKAVSGDAATGAGSEGVASDKKHAGQGKGGDKADAAQKKGEGDEGDEAAVNEQELAAHHMPDLIEGVQPMFVKGEEGKDAVAKDKVAANAHAMELSTTSSQASSDTTAAAASAKGNTVAKDPGATAESSDDTVYYDCFDLKIVYERNRTGFEETKDYPIEINGVIAGRYQILEFLGAAAFSKAVQCVDLTDGSYVCIKIIKNNKDFFDQSLDEIKILKYINAHDTRDEHHLLQLYDYFYFKEHLFIVTELLRDNLYEFSKFNRESGAECYFTLPRLQKITRECLEGLKFVHKLGLIHCDLKPENVLIRSYSRCEVKIIDFGSSCFVTDHLTSYVQSRSYRAPEVILGLPYDQQIDMWSLGCILAELWTGRVLFQNDSLATLLARVVGILGGIDESMLQRGRYSHRFFTKHKIIYDRLADDERSLVYIFPKKTTLRHRLGTDDALFVDFVNKLLQVDPTKRFSAEQALEHAWLTKAYPAAR